MPVVVTSGARATRTSRPGVALAVCVALALAGCGPRADALHGVRMPQPLDVGKVSVHEVREGGEPTPFAFRAEPGRLLWVFFGYAHCPDVCPTTLADLRRALRPLGADAARVDVAFVTVDPARDTAGVLLPFVHAFVPTGHALRPATQDELANAERAFGATSTVARRGDGTVDVSHTGAAYVVDRNGRVLVEWDYGTKPADMTADLRTLLALQRTGS